MQQRMTFSFLFCFLFLYLLFVIGTGGDTLEHLLYSTSRQSSTKPRTFYHSNREILDKSSFVAAYYSKIFRERGREASKKDGSSGALEALELLKHANLLYPQNSTRRDITHMLLQISRDKHPGSMFGSSSFKDLIDDWMETDDLAYEEILLVGLELHFDKSYERAMTIYQYIIESKRYEKLNQPFYKYD